MRWCLVPRRPRTWQQYWFDPEWRAANLHYQLSAQLVQGRHPAGGQYPSRAGLAGRDPRRRARRRRGYHLDPSAAQSDSDAIALRREQPLVAASSRPDPGLQTTRAGAVLCRLSRPDRGPRHAGRRCAARSRCCWRWSIIPTELEQELQAVNAIWFEVFERIYDEINEDGEMAFCYFSIWGPGRVAKLQSDISIMISPRNFRRFVQPYIREQCQWLDYSLYHLDGVDAVRHLDALLEIEELNAIQWTPGVASRRAAIPAGMTCTSGYGRRQGGHALLGGGERTAAPARCGRA